MKDRKLSTLRVLISYTIFQGTRYPKIWSTLSSKIHKETGICAFISKQITDNWAVVFYTNTQNMNETQLYAPIRVSYVKSISRN